MRNMTLLVVAIIAIAFCPDKVQSLDDPPSFDITYIKFNYESGYTDDALTIKVNASENIHIPEWHWWYVTLYDEEIAYIRTQSSRKVIFSVWIQTEEYIPGVMIRAVKTSGTGMGNINNTEVYFDSDSAFSHATTGTISGSVPSTVGKRDFTWEWEVTQIYLGEGGGEEEWEDLEEAISVGTTGPHDYYTVIDEPQDPMEVPWTEVLDFSCDWASGENSISGALEELTQELYSSGVEYEGGRTIQLLHIPT